MTVQDNLQLARALFQLTIYLETCEVPLTVKEFYEITYGELWEEMPGATWLGHLAEDPAVNTARDEPYTLKTVFDTMYENELGLLIEVIEEVTAKLGIGMGMISPGRYRRP
jgi:hypothetical protein